MVLNHIYYRRNEKGGKDYFPPSGSHAGARRAGPHRRRHRWPTAAAVEYGGVGKMGKSERNGVDPQDLIEKYGADTARLYTMFTAPPEATLEWNDAAVEGSYRFLRRVWNFGVAQRCRRRAEAAPALTGAPAAFGKDAKALRREVHTVLRQIDYDYQRMQYNTVVSGAMKLLNALEGFKADGSAGDAAARARGLRHPAALPVPGHAAHRARSSGSNSATTGRWASLLDAPWPAVDVGALEQDEIELMLQVNGKLRGALRVPAGASKEEIEKHRARERGLRQACRRRRAQARDRGARPAGQRRAVMKTT